MTNTLDQLLSLSKVKQRLILGSNLLVICETQQEKRCLRKALKLYIMMSPDWHIPMSVDNVNKFGFYNGGVIEFMTEQELIQKCFCAQTAFVFYSKKTIKENLSRNAKLALAPLMIYGQGSY